MNPITPEPLKEFDHLPVSTTRLNELDHLILFILAESGPPKGMSDILKRLEELWQVHNLTFHRSKKQVPNKSYFYARMEKLIDWFYINKVGKRAYRINWQAKKIIESYIVPYVRANYKIKNDGEV